MWVLILFAHVGPWGDTDSNALTVAQGFTTRAVCESAGNAAKHLADGTKKDIRYVCMPTDGAK